MEEFYDRPPQFDFKKGKKERPFRYLFDSIYPCNNILVPTFNSIIKIFGNSIDSLKKELNESDNLTHDNKKANKKVYNLKMLYSYRNLPASTERPKFKAQHCPVILSKCRDFPKVRLTANSPGGGNALNTGNCNNAGQSGHVGTNVGGISGAVSSSSSIGENSDSKFEDNENKSKQKKLEIIHVQLSLKEDIQLQSSTNAWKPASLRYPEETTSSDNDMNVQKDEYFAMKIRGILNKLTTKNLELLVEQILSIEKIHLPNRIECMLTQIFEKAIDESKFSNIYAKLCQRLETIDTRYSNNNRSRRKYNARSFRSFLLEKIDKEFELTLIDTVQSQIIITTSTIKSRSPSQTDGGSTTEEDLSDLEEKESKFRRKSCGTVNFIGELFKISMVDIETIQNYIQKLLKPFSERKLECLCKLLLIIGKKYENSISNQMSNANNSNNNINNPLSIELIIKNINQNVKKRQPELQISSRVKFIFQDVIDLHKDKWVSSGINSSTENSSSSSNKNSNTSHHSSNINNGGSSNNDNNQQQHHHSQNKMNYSTQNKKVNQSNDNRRDKHKDNKQFDPNKFLKNMKFDFSAKSLTLGARSQFTSFYGKSKIEQEQQAPSKIYKEITIDKKFILDLIDLVKENLKTNLCKIWDDISVTQHSQILNYILKEFVHYSKITKLDREILSNIIEFQYKRKKLNHDIICKSFKEFFQISPDILIDVPKMWQYIFEFIGPLLFKNILKLNDLLDNELNIDEYETIYIDLLKNCVKYFINEKGTNFIKFYWYANKNSIEKKFDKKFINEFIQKYNYNFLNDFDHYTFNPILSVQNNNKQQNELNSKSDSDIKCFTKYLVEANLISVTTTTAVNNNCNNITLETGSTNINCNVLNDKCTKLTKLMCDFTLKYDKENNIFLLDKEIFNDSSIKNLLTKNLCNTQLECLYAIELFFDNLKIFYNNINGILNEIYDKKIISHDVFLKWSKLRSKNELLEPFINFPLVSEIQIHSCIINLN